MHTVGKPVDKKKTKQVSEEEKKKKSRFLRMKF